MSLPWFLFLVLLLRGRRRLPLELSVPLKRPTPISHCIRASTYTGIANPQEVYAEYPNEQFQNFDTYAAQFNAQPAVPPRGPNANGFPSPPTPPTLVHAQQGQVLNGAAIKASPPDLLPLGRVESAEDLAQGRRGGSNSEEDELTPAQSRRKAQNRAA